MSTDKSGGSEVEKKKNEIPTSVRLTEEQNSKLNKIKTGMGISKQFCIKKGLDLFLETKEVKDFLQKAN